MRPKHTNWIQESPPADVERKSELQTKDRSYSETHPWDCHGPDDKTHDEAHDVENGASLRWQYSEFWEDHLCSFSAL